MIKILSRSFWRQDPFIFNHWGTKKVADQIDFDPRKTNIGFVKKNFTRVVPGVDFFYFEKKYWQHEGIDKKRTANHIDFEQEYRFELTSKFSGLNAIYV